MCPDGTQNPIFLLYCPHIPTNWIFPSGSVAWVQTERRSSRGSLRVRILPGRCDWKTGGNGVCSIRNTVKKCLLVFSSLLFLHLFNSSLINSRYEVEILLHFFLMWLAVCLNIVIGITWPFLTSWKNHLSHMLIFHISLPLLLCIFLSLTYICMCVCICIYIYIGNAGSPTHWVRPRIKPSSSWILVRFINCWATKGTPESHIYI